MEQKGWADVFSLPGNSHLQQLRLQPLPQRLRCRFARPPAPSSASRGFGSCWSPSAGEGGFLRSYLSVWSPSCLSFGSCLGSQPTFRAGSWGVGGGVGMVAVMRGNLRGPKRAGVGIGKVLYLHRFQAPPLSLRLTSSPILKSHSAPQFQGTRVRKRCGTRRRFRATPGHKASAAVGKDFPLGGNHFPLLSPGS